MGTFDLIARLALPVALALAGAVLGCKSAPVSPPADASRVTLASRGGRGAHVQIVRALPMPERLALVERFRARNGPEWKITLGAGGAPDDVEPIRGLVRRAKREVIAPPDTPAPTATLDEERAIAATSAFLSKNADFFGMSADDVPTLDLAAGPAKTTTYGIWVVHARGLIPMRGYEGFEPLASMIDALVYIGDDGAPRYFVNLSRVHPRIVLDTIAILGPDDKRLLTHVVGRELFVVVDDPLHPNARVRELRRVSVGRVEDKDVRAVRLTIHASPGPRAVYVSYWLAYAVDVVRERHAFRFIVDADTGDLLDDAVVPVVQRPGPDDED